MACSIVYQQWLKAKLSKLTKDEFNAAVKAGHIAFLEWLTGCPLGTSKEARGNG